MPLKTKEPKSTQSQEMMYHDYYTQKVPGKAHKGIFFIFCRFLRPGFPSSWCCAELGPLAELVLGSGHGGLGPLAALLGRRWRRFFGAGRLFGGRGGLNGPGLDGLFFGRSGVSLWVDRGKHLGGTSHREGGNTGRQ